MTPEGFLVWLKGWLLRHPLQSPPAPPQERYTAEVMARIRHTDAQRRPALAWHLWPRLSLALGAVAACAVVGVVMLPHKTTQLAQRQDQDALPMELKTHQGPRGSHATVPTQGTTYAMLAESSPNANDDAWIAQTLQLLDELDEEPQANPADQEIDDLLRELKALDDSEIASS